MKMQCGSGGRIQTIKDRLMKMKIATDVCSVWCCLSALSSREADSRSTDHKQPASRPTHHHQTVLTLVAILLLCAFGTDRALGADLQVPGQCALTTNATDAASHGNGVVGGPNHTIIFNRWGMCVN